MNIISWIVGLLIGFTVFGIALFIFGFGLWLLGVALHKAINLQSDDL